MNFKKRILQGVVGAWVAMGSSGVYAAARPEPDGQQICSEVESFHDGDTFTCVTETGPLRVRVAGIDAPEVGQGFWRVSRNSLRSSTTAGSLVSCYKVDRFKQQVCRVFSADGQDLALGLVKAGLAWHTVTTAISNLPKTRPHTLLLRSEQEQNELAFGAFRRFRNQASVAS